VLTSRHAHKKALNVVARDQPGAGSAAETVGNCMRLRICEKRSHYAVYN